MCLGRMKLAVAQKWFRQGFAQSLAHLQAAVTDPATKNMMEAGRGGTKNKTEI